MTKQILAIMIFLLMGLSSIAQQKLLVFYNESIHKAVQIKTNALVMIQYKGYLQQEELTTNNLMSCNDSIIILAQPRMFAQPLNPRKIKLEDITGFRKVSVGSQLLKFGITLGVTLGTFFTISNNDQFSSTEQLIYSSAAGLATNYGLKLIFPMNRVKYKLKDGWKIMIR